MVFQGFYKETFQFFEELSRNNDKFWFDDHRGDYDSYVLEPARQFVTDMGEALQAIAPQVVADPRVNRSLFRINRDTRFSKDKRPYKTHMGIWMWDGPQVHRMNNSGFYFHLEPQGVFFAVGMHCFPKDYLEAYRQDTVHPNYGKQLATMMASMKRKKGLELGGSHYKRVPRGFPADHPNADYLRYNGLTASTPMIRPEELYSSNLIRLALKHYKAMLPVHQWLRGMTERLGVEEE